MNKGDATHTLSTLCVVCTPVFLRTWCNLVEFQVNAKVNISSDVTFDVFLVRFQPSIAFNFFPTLLYSDSMCQT